ncbi:elongation factor G [Striga asiatica]|uniref:Elongation factor G n=1 Tax=Striga asiatica TaxID=4170 RepID=A0A5A7RJ47_STRAF|nr:elongation factor G [Striga asiatica]
MAVSRPPTNSTAAIPEGTLKCLESMYLTGLRYSTIHPGMGEYRSWRLGRTRMPVEKFLNTWGPFSKPPFFTKFPVKNGRHLKLLMENIKCNDSILPSIKPVVSSISLIAIASNKGPHVGSSCVPGLWNVTLTTLDRALKLHAYVSPPSVLYNVCIGRSLDIPGTDTLSTSSCAHVRVAPKTEPGFRSRTYCDTEASFPSLTAWAPRGMLK